MEASASKRRKTSPTTSMSLGSDAARSSSSGGTRRLRRPPPSSGSPMTRASPNIFERRDVPRTSRQTNAPTDTAGDDEARDLAAQLEGASENRPTSDPASLPPEPQSPARPMMSGLRGKPRRSINRPSPRPLPPPSAQEEELLDPFKGRVLRRSPPRGVLPRQEPEEPELPPTPSRKGLSDSRAVISSPIGIHNTPSKRPRRSRALADKLRSGSSPLKHPPMRPLDLGLLEKPATRAVLKPSRAATAPAPADLDEQVSAKTTRRKPSCARQVPEFDPFAEQKDARDLLMAQVAQLKADVEVIRIENDRLYALQQGERNAATLRSPRDPAVLLDVLQRHALPPEDENQPDLSSQWLDLALDPMAFLPFGNASAISSNSFESAETETEQIPVSHHPIPLSIDEELPYLQLFTPLVFNSTTTAVPRASSINDSDVHSLQHHKISVSSNPAGLFAARIEMLVNTKTLSISELSVPKIDPAAAELEPFVTKILDDQAISSSALKRNVSVLSWAMAEWTRLASKRARFWCHVTQELGTREGILKCAKKSRSSRKSARMAESDAEDSGEDEIHKKRQFSRSQIMPWLGHTSLDLDLTASGAEVGLRISWKIGFDWTGEGQSTIQVLVQTPGKWHSEDKRASLAGIQGLFGRLIEGGGTPMFAVQTVVALIVGDVENGDGGRR